MFTDSNNSDNRAAVWEFISHKFEANVPVMLICVLESHGSSPGRQGFKMAVAGDSSFCGTIGGGIMEHKFVELAKAELPRSSNVEKLMRQIHDKSATEQSGMICSGEQTNFLYRVSQKDIPHIQALIESLWKNHNGSLTIGSDGIFFSEEPAANDYFFRPSGEGFVYIEKTGYKNILHIIGGGHCSLALSRLMRDLDFFIKVYDNRDELLTMEQNNYVHQKIIVDDYSMLGSLIDGGYNEYAVIMTFGYRTDDIAFRTLMGKHFKYLGMLGSKKKIEKMFSDYRHEQIDEAILKRVFAPVGIQIKSETTSEIAVSIAAQIIAEKNKI